MSKSYNVPKPHPVSQALNREVNSYLITQGCLENGWKKYLKHAGGRGVWKGCIKPRYWFFSCLCFNWAILLNIKTKDQQATAYKNRKFLLMGPALYQPHSARNPCGINGWKCCKNVYYFSWFCGPSIRLYNSNFYGYNTY